MLTSFQIFYRALFAIGVLAFSAPYTHASIIGDDNNVRVFDGPQNSAARTLSESIVSLRIQQGNSGYFSTCSATRVARNILLTASHCVDNAQGFAVVKISAQFGYLDFEKGDLIHLSDAHVTLMPETGLAFIRASLPDDRYPSLDLLGARQAVIGEPLSLLHFPGGRPIFIADSCSVRGLREPDHNLSTERGLKNVKVVLHDCDSTRGSSGGLLFSPIDGALIGIHFRGVVYDNINFANAAIALHPVEIVLSAIEEMSVLETTLSTNSMSLFTDQEPTRGTKLPKEKRLALLIANGAYDEELGFEPLTNTYNDVSVLEDLLSGSGFDVHVAEDLNRRKLIRTLEEFAVKVNKQEAESVIAFVYYAGHGAADIVDKKNFLLPVDAEINEYLWSDSVELGEWMAKATNRAKQADFIFMIDACRNELKLPTRSPAVGFFLPERMNNIALVFATGANRFAYDGTKKQKNGKFILALKEELPKTGRTLSMVFEEVRHNVSQRTDRRQKPEFINGLNRRIYLNGPPDPIIDLARVCAEGNELACRDLGREAQKRIR